MNQVVSSHTTSIKQIETQLGQISSQFNVRSRGALPSDTIANPKGNVGTCHIFAIITKSGKVLKGRTIVIEDDEVEEMTFPKVYEPPQVDELVEEQVIVEELQSPPSTST